LNTNEKNEKISELIEKLRKEAVGETRFPARFVLVKGLSAWQELLEKLKTFVDRTINLSSFCPDSDTFPYINDLPEVIQKGPDEKILLTPLSEYLRLNRSGAILRKFATLEKIGKSRIYIPLFEVDDLFAEEMLKVHRHRDKELPENYNEIGNGEIKIFIAPFKVNKEDYDIIVGIKKYMGIWERGGSSKIFLVTRSAPHLNPQIGKCIVGLYKNGYELLKKSLCDFQDKNLPANCGKEQDWQWLAENAKENEKFHELASRLLGMDQYKPDELFNQWNNFDDKQKWLSWLWTKIEVKEGTYLHKAISNCSRYDNLEKDLIFTVFTEDLTDNLLIERKNILLKIINYELPPPFWKELNGIKEPYKKLKSLAGITPRERKEITNLLSILVKEDQNEFRWMEHLKSFFQELYFYLSSFPFKDKPLKEYFQIYNMSRILDSPKEELKEKVFLFAKEKKVWDYPTRHDLLEKIKPHKNETPVLWVDGLGLEWTGLLKELIEKNSKLKVDVHIARANFPTTTDFNKEWEQEENIIDRELDKIAHEYDYEFPDSFINEISIIKKIADKILESVSYENEVIITSDHGLTRFYGSGNKKDLPIGAKIDIHSRFAKFKQNAVENTILDPSLAIDGSYVILLTHDEFTGQGGSMKEAQGGGTLEECLIPILHVRKMCKKHQEESSFKLLTPIIKLNPKGEGTLEGKLVGSKLSNLTLKIKNKSFVGFREETGLWTFKIKNIEVGKKRGKILSDNLIIKKIEFEITKGLREEDLGL